MKKEIGNGIESDPIDSERRQLLTVAGAGILAATFSGVAAASEQTQKWLDAIWNSAIRNEST